MATAPAWARRLVYAAATLFVWVFALMLFGAVLGMGIGLFASGGLRGAGGGVVRGGGIAFAVSFPLYIWGILIAVHAGMQDDRRTLQAEVQADQAAEILPDG